MQGSSCVAGLSVFIALGCGGPARHTVAEGSGVHPILPEPRRSLIPVIDVVTARGWTADAVPRAAQGTRVRAFASGLDHPRWLYVLPNGDVLVAETNAPPGKSGGLRKWFFNHYQKKAGGAVPSANRLTLLRDADGDGVAETRSVFLDSLMSPFGMALTGNTLWVANADAVVGFPYAVGQQVITSPGTKLGDLPGGPRNHHWTKSLLADPTGKRLYVGVGSNSNAGENGMEEEVGRAAIWEFDIAARTSSLYATGLRNPVGMAWMPQTGVLWVVVNERDELGSDLVPDYLTSVTKGGFYGWPYSYYGSHKDPRVRPPTSERSESTLVPDYALGPHTASLGLAWSAHTCLPPPFNEGMFVGQHGSWNRKPRSGYKVVFVPFRDGRPSGDTVDLLTGFVSDEGDAWGRPVGVAVDRQGALLVADDVGNTIWRVTSARACTQAP